MDPEQLKQLQAQFQQISGDLASGDPAKVKAAQTKLQALGYDVGTPDGKLGDKTSAAVRELRGTLETAGSNAATTATAEAEKAKNDPTNRLTKMATELGPWAGGMGVGVGAGLYTGSKFNAQDKAQKEAASKLSRAMDVTPEAGKSALKRMDKQRAVRGGRQFLGPAGFFGAGALTGEVIAPRFADDPETQKYINLAASTENAIGAGMAGKQLWDLGTRKDPIDPVDRARIDSRGPQPSGPQGPLSQAIDADPVQEPRRLPSPPDRPPPQGPAAPPAPTNPYNPGTAKYMAWQLKNDFGVKGAWSMRKPELAAKLSEQLAEHGTKRTVGKRAMDAAKKGGGKAAIPLAVGAYMAGAGDSEAADGSMASRAGDAAVNFGTGAGAAYGGIKLSDLLTKAVPTAMRSLGGGAAMAMPGEMVSAMTDYPQEDLNMGRNWLARNLPEGMQFGAVDEAREMATVPPRSPANAGPRVPQQEEPAPGGFSPNIQGRLQRMISLGAPPEAIASFLNQAAAR